MRSCTRPIAQALFLAVLAALPARAEIAGEQVVSGTATFDQSGNVTTIQASDGAIIEYSQFDIWANEELHFVQPSSDSRVLNRVFGDATHIDGGLYANGIVYIVNPAGVFFGPFAIVDVGGLYAAAGDISNEDFLARIDRFTLSGIVENAGSIESPAVALFGTTVANQGKIHAPDGTIALVAGEEVLLTQLGSHLAVEVEGTGGSAEAPAIEQTGSVDAGAGAVSFTTGDVYSLAINHTGITRGREIELRAQSGTVQVAGTLDASDRSAGATGGSIAVTGERVALLGARLDASGDAGGGEIRVGGDLHGEGALPTARRSYVDEGSSLRADAISDGDGGRVIVWADEATAFHGTLSARGGAAGGDGGFAEISGAAFLEADGDVDLGAASGATGTLLYDPQEIQLIGGSPVTGDGSDSPDALPGRVAGDTDTAGQILFADVGTLAAPFQIYESEIEGTDANIVLEARNSISTPDAGAFAGAVTLVPTRSLTMTTRNDAGDETGSSFEPGIHLAGVSFQTTGAAISFSTGDGAIEVGNLTTAGAVAGGAGGAITLTANDADQSGDSHVTTSVLDASGGDGGTGAGGSGGAVTVRSVGAVEDIAGTLTDPTLGGGGVSVAGIDATGGTSASGAGGAGGTVTLSTTDGAIDTSAGAIDTSGGAGGTNGGNAGSIAITTRDANGVADGGTASAHVTTGALIATGGNGANGAGGVGGTITVNTRQSIEITGADNPLENQEPSGGGNVAIASIDTSGGNGGAGNGNRGGNITVATQSGDVSTGAIDATGGAGANAANTALGGRGGAVTLRAGTAENATSDLHLLGNIDAREGSSEAATTTSVDGGAVTLSAGDDIEHGGQVGPQIRTGGNVSLTADGDIGATSQLEIEGGGEEADTLTVSAGGRADVAVANAGFLGTLTVTATSVAADIDVTQFGDGGGDVIDMAGSGGEMVVNRVDTRDNEVNAVVALAVDDETTNGTLVLPTGQVDSGGTFTARSDGDLVVGRSDGIVIHATAVTLDAGDDIENHAQAGPHIDTEGNVSVTATGDIGATSPLRIEGGGGEEDALTVNAGGIANVDVTNAGFLSALGVTATSVDADIDVTQFGVHGGDAIAMASAGGQMVVTNVDTRDSGVAVDLRFDLPTDAASDGALVLATDSVKVAGTFDARSDGDLVVGTSDGTAVGAYRADSADPDAPPDPIDVLLVADFDGDGKGALRDADGAATGRIDLLGTAGEVGELGLFAGEGVGTAAEPITLQNGGLLSASNSPRKEDPPDSGQFINDRNATTGIFVRNVGSGDLTLAASSRFSDLPGVEVGAGEGDIEVTNEAGGIIVQGELGSKPVASSDGAGGDVTLAVLDPDSRIVLDTPAPIRSGGLQTYNGDVVLASAASLAADGGVTINGGLATQDTAASAMPFSAVLGDGTTFTLLGGVDAQHPLGSFTLSSALLGPGLVKLKTPGITTAGGQTYRDEIVLLQDTSLTAGGTVEFAGNVKTEMPNPAADFTVTTTDRVLFSAAGAQSVTTAGDIAFSPAGRADLPREASIAKPSGNLTLTSDGGSVILGDREKTSVAGSLAIMGNTVRLTDLSALDISVTSPDVQIFARSPGTVATASGKTILDGGTDLVANTAAFSSAPGVVGGGPAPRIATASGTAQNAGVLAVVPLPVSISAADIARGSRVFDLAIPVVDPHETQEIPSTPVELPLEPQLSQDRAGPGAPVSREEVVAFFACAPVGDEALPAGCTAAPPAPPYGSALDTERADEIARAYRELLGDSASAAAGRAALARAAADPRAPLGSATSLAGRVYLTEVARVLGQVRLLGLGERYAEVRADLLAAVAAAIGSRELDTARLGAAVDARAMGMPI